MSVRSERAPLDTGMANLDLNGAIPATPPTSSPANHVEATIGAAQAADSTLAEANTLSTNHPEHPLKRTVVATIRASLGELCLRKQKATWAPSPEALRGILQCAQRPPTKSADRLRSALSVGSELATLLTA
jgi:hypothetical protein